MPDPRPIEIDNFTDTISPHASLNGTSLHDRERVALARLQGVGIAAGSRVRAHATLELAEALARALDALGDEHDTTLLESIELDGAIQLLFAGEPDGQDSMAANSAAGRAVEKLIGLIVLASLEEFTYRINLDRA